MADQVGVPGAEGAKPKEGAPPLEIERKWLVDTLPDLSEAVGVEIEQGYLPSDTEGVEIRVRRKGSKFYRTEKTGTGAIREEKEEEISEEQFRELWEQTEGRIEKTRYVIPDGDFDIELDVYRGALEGHAVAEVEFNSSDAQDEFRAPGWFSREVTGDKAYSNALLASEGWPEDVEKSENPDGAQTEAEAREIPKFELERWTSEMVGRIESILENQERAVVNIAGASASGKGEATEHLRRVLEEAGHTVLMLSSDDYYKGISMMMAEESLEGLPSVDLDPKNLREVIHNQNGEAEFGEKFSEANLAAIREAIANQYTDLPADDIVSAISEAFVKIDFDNPKAVDLHALNQTLIGLKAGEDGNIPTYSMKYGEPVGQRSVTSGGADVILVEGIYGLNGAVTETSDLRSFIETENKTLLMRRFRRDVLSGRSSFSPEFTLWFVLKVVLPAYKRHILPDRAKADMILKNDYTGVETFDTNFYDVQDKIPLTGEETERLKEEWGEPVAVKIQEDYYFASSEEGHNPEHLIRVRVENGRIKDLVHKGTRIERPDGKVVRPTETYIRNGEFGSQYRDVETLMADFLDAGFSLVGEIRKTREEYSAGNVDISLDRVDGLGVFIELRSNNRISKESEIDAFIEQANLEGRKSIGPYIDEYLAKTADDPAEQTRLEVALNGEGPRREELLRAKVCETVELTDDIDDAFRTLRKGYPERNLAEQASGAEFRSAAEVVMSEIAKMTMAKNSSTRPVVLMPWRSGLAFGASFKSQEVDSFYHLSSKRDEETLQTVVDYESGEVDEQDVVIIADPMLATGNTIIDAVRRMRDKGVAENNIIINSVVAAPVGVARVKKEFPEVQIIVGSLDEKLDHRGYIVPGLGDFGDKYFASFSSEEINQFVDSFELSDIDRAKMIERIKKQSVSEAMRDLVERDFKDLEIDRANRENLVSEGLEITPAKRKIRIDTGRTESREEVAAVIAGEVGDDVRVISIEGMSGTGKSSAAESLRKKVDGLKVSMGEIFRYLTYLKMKDEGVDLGDVVRRLEMRIGDGGLELFDGETNISDSLAKALRERSLENALPAVAAENQKRVIAFVADQIARLRESTDRKLLIEGRAYTIDFIPSDLRVQLVADPGVRAERRFAKSLEDSTG